MRKQSAQPPLFANKKGQNGPFVETRPEQSVAFAIHQITLEVDTLQPLKTKFDVNYWENRWREGQTGWDIGAASTPLIEYFDQLNNRKLKILIPGCGNAWEGEYLYKLGFENVFLLDWAAEPLQAFHKRNPGFPSDHLIVGDFFKLEGQFDLIIEQTFFCALDPIERGKYAEKVHQLLRDGGRLVGVLFENDFGEPTPPFGGHREEYLSYFLPWFEITCFETANNSIKPRNGRELFMNLKKLNT